jgi:hypothetical protein
MIIWLEDIKIKEPITIDIDVNFPEAAESATRASMRNVGIVRKVQVLREFMNKLEVPCTPEVNSR